MIHGKQQHKNAIDAAMIPPITLLSIGQLPSHYTLSYLAVGITHCPESSSDTDTVAFAWLCHESGRVSTTNTTKNQKKINKNASSLWDKMATKRKSDALAVGSSGGDGEKKTKSMPIETTNKAKADKPDPISVRTIGMLSLYHHTTLLYYCTVSVLMLIVVV
jgi:hypothetical protein